MKQLLAVTALLLTTGSAFAAWPSSSKENLRKVFFKVCRSKVKQFDYNQCVRFSKCVVSTFEVAYPNLQQFLVEGKNNPSRRYGEGFFVGRYCAAKIINSGRSI